MCLDRRSLRNSIARPATVFGLTLALAGCGGRMEPVAARLVPQGELHPVATTGPGCSAEQYAAVSDAFARGQYRLGQAMDFLRQNPRDPHVQRWFGNAPSEVTLATMEATAARMARADGVRLECNDAQVCADGKIAYARMRSGRLGVCPRFFQTGVNGLDSRFGTLIHEMTHIAARTGDHAYRPAGAARIAGSNAVLAARNADNYQYFVETLPMATATGTHGDSAVAGLATRAAGP